MSNNPSTRVLSATDKLVLQELQKRRTMNLKGSLDTDTYPYRQYLRSIDKLVEKSIITGWVPVFHPFTGEYKKLVWFFVRTNPRDPQDLEFLKSLGGQLLSLDGIAGPYSLSALIQFTTDQEFNNSLAYIDSRFSKLNPVYQNIRYQWLEIIAFYKYNGFAISNDEIPSNQQANNLKKALLTAGIRKHRPPTIEDLAKDLCIANSTVQKQLKQLEDTQTILGYSILINSVYQPQIKVIIQFHIHPSNYSEVIQTLRDDPHISILCKIQKESFNLLAVVYMQSIQDLNIWITDLYAFNGILDTLTTIVLKNEHNKKNNEYFPLLQ